MTVRAIHARAASDCRACAVHLPLVLYLACLTALLGLFAVIIHGLAQPTVVPGAVWADSKEPRPDNLVLQKNDSSAEEMERAAIAAAETENRIQGIDPRLAFASVEPAAGKPRGSQVHAAAAPRAKQAKPKPKYVARRNPVADPWRSSWNTPWHHGNTSNGHAAERDNWRQRANNSFWSSLND